jgi:hypothetical protein
MNVLNIFSTFSNFGSSDEPDGEISFVWVDHGCGFLLQGMG